MTVWGKLQNDAEGRIIREQSLAAHCRDVAAVFAAMLAVPTLRSRLAHLAGEQTLSEIACARLSYLVHQHDFGKVNAGFQARRSQMAPVVGHIGPIVALFGCEPDPQLNELAQRAFRADRLAQWTGGSRELLDAILSHHGKPWPIDRPRWRDVQHWRRTSSGYDPIVAMSDLRSDAEQFLPFALRETDVPLPSTPAFVHAIAGLAQLADWIASSGWEHAPVHDTRAAWAERRLREIGVDPGLWRDPFASAGSPSFERLFGNDSYPHQEAAGSASAPLIILESETGSGKTEAALLRFARLFASNKVDGLFFALPTRTSAAQIHGRVEAFAKRMWPDGAPPVVLAVPGYLDRASGSANAHGQLPVAADALDIVEEDARFEPLWASEHPKRYFAGMLSVGTIDQALLSALRVKHAHMRGAALMRHLLVVDEVHASDAYMRRLLVQLLRDHVAAGGQAMLLSATLGAEARHQILATVSGVRVSDVPAPTLRAAIETEYPCLSSSDDRNNVLQLPSTTRSKPVRVRVEEWIDEPETIAAEALSAARRGAKVLLIRNTVAGAVAVQRALEGMAEEGVRLLFNLAGIPTLHHGRFALEDRRLLDGAVQRGFGKRRAAGGLVLVGTQTLEQSLDIDADLLITDLCPMDVLLQRIGRLHRHTRDEHEPLAIRPAGFTTATVVVLAPTAGLESFLPSKRPGGLPRHGLGHTVRGGVPQGVYRDLLVLEATRRLLVSETERTIPHHNRELVERAMHSYAIEQLLDSLPSDERDRWQLHRNTVVGDDLSQAQIARDGLLLRSEPFMAACNAKFDEHLTTRLGAESRLLSFPLETSGPFGSAISRIAIPDWMLREVPHDATIAFASQAQRIERVLQFRVGDSKFCYDRHGLHQISENM